MDYTIYTKIKEKNGKAREIMAIDLPFSCRCPECNPQTRQSDLRVREVYRQAYCQHHQEYALSAL